MLDIRRAVLLFLGGCHPAEAPIVGIAPPTVDASPIAAPDAEPAPTTIASGDPATMCHSYRVSREGTADDPRKMPKKGPLRNARVAASVRRDPSGSVQCVIVWDKRETIAVVSVAPTCCPSPMPNVQQPCPPPHDESLPAEEATIERVVIDANGTIALSNVEWYRHVEMPPRHNCGRRPEGFALPCGDGSIGAVLAEMAVLEAASVQAFVRLASELEHHGAPSDLVRRANRARADEVRHAKVMARLARRFGARVRFPRATRMRIRPRFEVAVENLVEGCVRETFGAAIATVQGERAEHARETFRAIADDECEHAALAWDVHEWFSQKSSAAERRMLDEARARTLDTIDHTSASPDVRAALGLPSPEESRALLALLRIG